MKKPISLLAILVFVCSLLSIGACASAQTNASQGFADVPPDAWYAEAVNYVKANNLMNGNTETQFNPEQSLTRAMLATVLWRQAGKPEVNFQLQFTDLAAGQWYTEAIRWAAGEGLVNGYGEGLFGPEDIITQEQLNLIINRYTEQPATRNIPGFAGDRQPATRAQVAAALLNLAGIKEAGTMEKESEQYKQNRVLVAYFSATGTTKPLAEYAADILGADIYEIVPTQPYTAADLAYYTNGRADREQNDSNARPSINGKVANMADYDVVFIGYPIWHGQAPRIISTFLESYDFSGKTIVPFCTSHSSGIGSSASSLHALAGNANWLAGQRFAGGTTRNAIENWIASLNLPKAEQATPAAENNTDIAVFDFESKTVRLNSGYDMPIYGLGTYSLHGETCVNAVKSALASGVRLIDTAHMYGNEAEIGRAVRESMQELGLKREEIFVTTKIYPGSDMANPEAAIQACLDRLDIEYIDLMLLHHPDSNDVKAYKAMEQFVADGKIRSIGLSNWYVEELTDFLPQVSIKPALVQNEIHPYYQENKVIPFIQSQGIVVQGWYPLGGRGHTAELLGNEVISAIGAAHGKSSAQVILRWNLQKGVAVIPGSSNPAHIKENTELFDFELTAEEMAQINALDRNEKHDWY